MRKLASIRKVSKILPIDGADRIELVQVDGWQVICEKGKHQVGEKVVYCEVDSFLPEKPEYEFLRKSSYKTLDNVGGFRLRTMKMRGQISQGLLLSLDEKYQDKEIGFDMTDILGIKLYEKPLPVQLQGKAKSTFPTHILPKTDEERIQNLGNKFYPNGFFSDDREWVITEKLDGTSSTFFIKDGEFGICGRNIQFEHDVDNVYTQIAQKYSIEDFLRSFRFDCAIQGEIIGGKIQGNKYRIDCPELHVFNFWDLESNSRLFEPEFVDLVQKQINWVPILEKRNLYFLTLDEILNIAVGKSQLYDTEREGIVCRSADQTLSFKVISNKFLLKDK